MIATFARILIAAPHPDDEIAACAIAASRAIAAGARVFVLHLTTGIPEAAVLWPWQRSGHFRRVWRRQDEALDVARLLGLEVIGFRDTPARRLRFDLDRAVGDVKTAIAACGAEVLWVPAFEGAHQDHDAANVLAASFASAIPVWEFAAYNFAGGRVRSNRFAAQHRGEIAIDPTPEEAERKRAALARYVSERGNLRHIRAEREAYRPLPAHDYGCKPHPGRLFRERFHWVPFRHPRVDFAASADVYRDLAGWTSARRSGRAAVLGNGPGGETRQADGKLTGALDEAKRQRGAGRQSGNPG